MVCPNSPILYSVNTYQVPFGWDVNTCNDYLWAVHKNGVFLEERRGSTFTYTFSDVGNYQVSVVASQCQPYFGGSTSISVNSRVKKPNPISGPLMCNTGQSYSFTSSPTLASQNPIGSDCYYHYAYLWTAPSGWSIQGGGNTYFGVPTVNITAPIGTPQGSYTITIKSSIHYGGTPIQSNSWFSEPVNYTVQVGPISGSQVSVSGTSAVCNGNSYTYTANVPGGHKSGYSYSWTYPSGWSVESSSTNTIRLYVPSYNSSYGPIRVSVNTGCGSPSSLSGITAFPCNYMMSTGSFKVYPNPTSNELNVEYFFENDSLKSSFDPEQGTGENLHNLKIFKIKIYDQSEQMVRSAETKNGKINLDTKGLRPGTYYIHIYSDQEVIMEQILIE